jgi:glycosyltransferase involved in cell wall biosynthesis
MRPESGHRMRVLLVSHAFPPRNVVGAVRVGKFASYLHQAGHDVRVVAAPTTGDQSLVVDFPLDRVAYADERAVEPALSRVVKRIRGFPTDVRGGTATPRVAGPAAPARTGLSAVLARHFSALLHIPDARAGWIGAATVAGREIARGWRPDIVFASAPPYSALIAASRIARACDAPWIAEIRDLWVGNPYSNDPAWRRWIDRFLEWRVLGSAAALVTISPSCAAALRCRHRQPIACVLNGYVEEDFPAEPAEPPPGEVVSILYTGGIYPGYRDPSPLFRAIAGLGAAERQRIAVHFYGPPAQEVAPLAAEHGVADRVFVHDPVPYKASLALQTLADVLLLLQWNDQKDAGTLPAKFFEYLGARRPILSLGYEHGDLAAMIRERAAGLVANDPEVIAQQLRGWIAQKPAGIPPVAPQARAGLTRAEQYSRLEQFLTGILRIARRGG